MNPRWLDLAERMNNFHGDHEEFLKQAADNEAYFEELIGVYDWVITDIGNYRWLTKEQILKLAFTRIYDLVAKSENAFFFFNKNRPLHDSVFDACFFAFLCMFIHQTKKIKGISITKFLEDNNPSMETFGVVQ